VRSGVESRRRSRKAGAVDVSPAGIELGLVAFLHLGEGPSQALAAGCQLERGAAHLSLVSVKHHQGVLDGEVVEEGGALGDVKAPRVAASAKTNELAAQGEVGLSVHWES
jgi:hypothetical protein